MYCPFCLGQDTKVVDSRLAGEGVQVRRRRQCLSCHERFTTYEVAELSLPKVVKSDETREAFSESKLRSGIQKSLEKRPVSVEQIESAVNRIKHHIIATGEREVSSLLIGQWVMEELRKLDHVAYIRFASIYRSFEDVHAFREVIDTLEKEPPVETAKDQLSLL
ncbi:MAG: transcriptional regulator NrdR [Gammaproteobacteria bacterium]|nr:transcriptional regulator NrdR [Gammaproteobacteria bacterium]